MSYHFDSEFREEMNGQCCNEQAARPAQEKRLKKFFIFFLCPPFSRDAKNHHNWMEYSVNDIEAEEGLWTFAGAVHRSRKLIKKTEQKELICFFVLVVVVVRNQIFGIKFITRSDINSNAYTILKWLFFDFDANGLSIGAAHILPPIWGHCQFDSVTWYAWRPENWRREKKTAIPSWVFMVDFTFTWVCRRTRIRAMYT